MLSRRDLILLSGAGATSAAWKLRASDSASSETRIRVRMLVSRNFAPDLNENDARAALQAWGDALARQGRLAIDVGRSILTPSEELLRLVRRGDVDAMGLTLPEFLQVASFLDQETLIVDVYAAKGGDPYVLLVGTDSGINRLEDLRARTLILHKGPRASMAEVWLTTLLAGARLPVPEAFFARVSDNNNISRGVVLPVFFKQADACVVTSRGFLTLCELNPQLGKKLRVLATSPPLLTGVVVFHRDCPAERKDVTRSVLLQLHNSVFGRQALTLFQTERLMAAGRPILRNAVELLAAYEKIRGHQAVGRR